MPTSYPHSIYPSYMSTPYPHSISASYMSTPYIVDLHVLVVVHVYYRLLMLNMEWCAALRAGGGAFRPWPSSLRARYISDVAVACLRSALVLRLTYSKPRHEISAPAALRLVSPTSFRGAPRSHVIPKKGGAKDIPLLF